MDQSKGGHVHAFLLDDGRDLTLIDTLFDTDARRILDRISAIGKSVGDLKHIVLTHGHRSHLGGLATLERPERRDRLLPRVGGGHHRRRASRPAHLTIPMRPLRTYWRVYYLQFGAALGRGKHPPCPVDSTLKDGDMVGPVRVLHHAGPHPGPPRLLVARTTVLFAGDAIATYPVFAPGWPVFTLNPTQHRASISAWRISTRKSSPSGTETRSPRAPPIRLRSLVESL